MVFGPGFITEFHFPNLSPFQNSEKRLNKKFTVFSISSTIKRCFLFDRLICENFPGMVQCLIYAIPRFEVYSTPPPPYKGYFSQALEKWKTRDRNLKIGDSIIKALSFLKVC